MFKLTEVHILTVRFILSPVAKEESLQMWLI